MTAQQPFGVLNIDKPAGMTSRDVVDHVVRLVRPAKAGHAGTLDPLATGVLAVCVGAATRLIPHIQQRPKQYRAEFLLGSTSDTDDITGNVVETPRSAPVTREQIEELLPRFVGRIEQVPPQFSAVHVKGRRAYDLARQGKTVEVGPRTVDVYHAKLVRFVHPELELEIECGSGTYIRAIGRDLGKLLGCGAVMSRLVRTRIGPYRIQTETKLTQLDAQSLSKCLLPATTAVEHLPFHRAAPEQLVEMRHGRPFRSPQPYEDGTTVAVLTPDEQLACLANYRRRDGTLAPKQVFLR